MTARGIEIHPTTQKFLARMNSHLVVLALAGTLVRQAGFAQDAAVAAADDSRPASSNIQGQAYPRIHSDLRGSFRIKAPQAQQVVLDLGKRYL